MSITPFLLEAPIKDYIWGGTRLRDEFGKHSDKERLAESWELSCHPDGGSIAASGEHTGKLLADILKEHPEYLGEKAAQFRYFPVLVKLIDAKDNLSVQVHPDDEYALRTEGEYGKTEMWYIVDCDEGAELIYGFRSEITREEFVRAIEDNTLLDLVNRVPVKKGDVFFIPSGTLHAIGKGILIAEIQQNSNTTYRVYDYGRVGADGKPRELHIEKAAEVTRLTPQEAYTPDKPDVMDGLTMQCLASCRYFHVMKLDLTDDEGELTLCGNSEFQHILVIDGRCELQFTGGEVMGIQKGNSVFVPAGSDAFIIKGKCSMIITTVN